MKMYKMSEAEYASTRLVGSIVMFEGNPIEVVDMIHSDKYGFVARGQNIITGDPVQAPYNSLDISPVQIGYVNYQGVASYICRAPLRGDYRQGLRYNNLRNLSGIFVREIPYKYIGDAIVGCYPDLKTCIELVTNPKKGVTSIAWDRFWAIDSELNLIYKGEDLAGRIVGGRCVLSEQASFLQEALDDSLRNMLKRF